MAKQNLLLVDADLRSLRVLEVSLRKAGYNVASIGNGRDALAMLEQSRPDLVLCDTRLPGLDGFELIEELRKRVELADIPLMILSSDVSVETKVRGLQLGVEDYLTKPIYIKELLARVSIVLQRKRREGIEQLEHGNKRRFSGSLTDMGVVDLLQAVDHNKKSGVLYLKSGSADGAIYFCNGAPVDATVGRLQATRAIYRTLLWTEGTFEIDFREVDREDHVQSGMQALLMEGLRRVDEWGRLLEQLPDMDTVFEISETQLFSRLGEIPDQINSVLREVDGERSLWQILDACDGDDLETLNALSKLYFEGLLYNTGRHPDLDAPREREHEPQPEPSEIVLPHISSGPPMISHTLAPAWPSVPSGDPSWTRVDDDTFQINIPRTPRVPEEPIVSLSQAPKRRKGRKRKRRGPSQSLANEAGAKGPAREAAEVQEVDESVAEITPSTIAPPPEPEVAPPTAASAAKQVSVPPPLPATAKPPQRASWPAEPVTSEVSLAQLTDVGAESNAPRARDAELPSAARVLELDPRNITVAPGALPATPPPLAAASLAPGHVTPPPLPGAAERSITPDAGGITLLPGASGTHVETTRPPGIPTVPPLSAASSAPPGPTTLRPQSTSSWDRDEGAQLTASDRERAAIATFRESLAALSDSDIPASSPPIDAEAVSDLSFTEPPAAAGASRPPLDAEAANDLSFTQPPAAAAASRPPLDAEAATDLSFTQPPAAAAASRPPLDAEAAEDLSFADSPALATASKPPGAEPEAGDAAVEVPALAAATQPPIATVSASDVAPAPADTEPPASAELAPPTAAPETRPPLDAEAASDLSFEDAPTRAAASEQPVADVSFSEVPALASPTQPPSDARPGLTSSTPGVAMPTQPPLDAEPVSASQAPRSEERSVPALVEPSVPPLGSKSIAPHELSEYVDTRASTAPSAKTRSSASPPPLPGQATANTRSAASPPPLPGEPVATNVSVAPAKARSSASPPPLPGARATQPPLSETGRATQLGIAASMLSFASDAPNAESAAAPARDSNAPVLPAAAAQPPDFDAAAARLAGPKKKASGAESSAPLDSGTPSLRHIGPPPRAATQPRVTAKPPPFAAANSASQSPSSRAGHAPQHRTDVPPAFGVPANDNASRPPRSESAAPSSKPSARPIAAGSDELSSFAKLALALNSDRPEASPANDVSSSAPQEAAAAALASNDELSAALSASNEKPQAASDAPRAASETPPTAASARDVLSQMPTEAITDVAAEPSAAPKAASQGVWSAPSKAPSIAAPTPKRRSKRWMQVGSVAAATALAAGLYALRARDAVPQGSLMQAVPQAVPTREIPAEPAATAPAPQPEPQRPSEPESVEEPPLASPEAASAKPAAQAPETETTAPAKPSAAETTASAPKAEPPPTPAKPSAAEATASAAKAEPQPIPAKPSAAESGGPSKPASSGDAAQVLAKGRSLEQKGKKKDALALYEKTVAEGGGSSQLQSHMAFMYLNQGNNAQAEAHALKASTADETNSEAWIVLGAARAQLGKKAAADEAYRSCAKTGLGQYVTECRRMLR